MAPAGGVQTREYERWDYGWRSVNMGGKCLNIGWKTTKSDICIIKMWMEKYKDGENG